MKKIIALCAFTLVSVCQAGDPAQPAPPAVPAPHWQQEDAFRQALSQGRRGVAMAAPDQPIRRLTFDERINELDRARLLLDRVPEARTQDERLRRAGLAADVADAFVQISGERARDDERQMIEGLRNELRNRNAAAPQPNLDQPRAQLHPLWWMTIGGLSVAVVYKVAQWAGWLDKKEEKQKAA